MNRDAGDFVPRKGMRVIGSDDQHVGDIDVVEAAYVIVQHGLFPQDYYIPLSSIVSHDDDAVYLNTTKDDALERGLGNPMVAFAGHDDVSRGGDSSHTDDDDAVAPQDSVPAAALNPDLELAETDDAIIAADEATRPPTIADDMATGGSGTSSIPGDSVADDGVTVADGDAPDDDRQSHRTIELHEEEVTATTRPVERGPVRLRKEVVEERQTFEVPIVEEEVIVTRRRVDKDVPDPDAAFTEEHVEIPIRGQKVELETRAHVVEEIDIDKTAHERIEHVTETVRHEEVRVDGDIDTTHDRPSDTPVT